MQSLKRVGPAACAAILLLAGCQSAAPRPAGGSGASSQTTPAGGGRTVAASETDNGHTITLAVGDVVVVELHNTYWQFAPVPQSAALKLTGPSSVVPSQTRSCVPGQGCGTVRESFQATSPGRAVIAASRTSCGEARRCTGTEGAYSVSVVVG